MFASSLCRLLLLLVLLLLVALLLLPVGMPADFVETWFRLLVYPKRLQASLGYTQSRNPFCTTLLLLLTIEHNFASREALLNKSGFDFWCTPSSSNQAWGTPKVETILASCCGRLHASIISRGQGGDPGLLQQLVLVWS